MRDSVKECEGMYGTVFFSFLAWYSIFISARALTSLTRANDCL
jgi:hypothetical protein